MPRFSQPEPSVEEGVLPSAGVICICGVGSEEPLPCVVAVALAVAVVVPPSGTVSPMLTVVQRAQHAPVKRARQSENRIVACVMRIASQKDMEWIIVTCSPP